MLTAALFTGCGVVSKYQGTGIDRPPFGKWVNHDGQVYSFYSESFLGPTIHAKTVMRDDGKMMMNVTRSSVMPVGIHDCIWVYDDESYVNTFWIECGAVVWKMRQS
jgi:hypothetical protein